MNQPRIRGIALFSLSLAATLISPQVLADGGRLLAQQPDCANPQTTLAMRVCADQRYQAADRRLNRVYQQLRASLSSSRRQRLITAQRAWIQYRDTTCRFNASQYEGGSFEPVEQLSCLAEATQQRTRELETALNSRR